MILNPRILTVWAALLARRLRRKRTVLWGHAWPRAGRSTRSDRVRNIMRRLADTLIVYSVAEADGLRKLMGTVDVVAAPNALYMAEDIRPAEGAHSLPSTFVFAGRLVPEKKPDLLLEAFRLALPRLPADVRLVFLGDGELRARLEHAAACNGIAARVTFRGHVTDVDALRAEYADAIASVSPGSVGLTLIQSIGFGVPVLAAIDELHGPEFDSGIEGKTLRTFESGSRSALAEMLVLTAESRSELLAARPEFASTIRGSSSLEGMVVSFLEALRLDDVLAPVDPA